MISLVNYSTPPMKYLNKQLFTAPTWAKCLTNAPAHRIALGNWPTPIFPFKYSGLPSDVEVFMKRDVRRMLSLLAGLWIDRNIVNDGIDFSKYGRRL